MVFSVSFTKRILQGALDTSLKNDCIQLTNRKVLRFKVFILMFFIMKTI
ncbi:hypothetical protein HNQ69_000097 [Bartonella callosciuri]|uniref:Uncharacterized protein n=1 Tax=Bartonella callosciuri TaxID=686223 RepID=A0A840NSN9_9HYPH|nr:hypothetical protein [Bartonella callosciuri]